MAGRWRERGWRGLAMVAGLAAITLGTSLGGSRRLTYHEAIVAQGAREMVAPGGDPVVPTLGGRPWLEKPPLAHWLVAAVGVLAGGVDEAVARVPSAVAAGLLCLSVAGLAGARFGPRAGVLSGLVQATTLWTVTRGRLADADILLASMVAGALLAFDRMRENRPGGWSWMFFGLVGAMSTAKGLGFGAVLTLSAVLGVMTWDRDRKVLGRLSSPAGWALAALLTAAWPVLVAWRRPEVVGLWWSHVADRLGGAGGSRFAGDPTWVFLLSILGLVAPWTPMALAGARRSWRRAVGRSGRLGVDRLLWCWAALPVGLLCLATVKNDHYLIHALAPWSVWSARGLLRLGAWLRSRRGWSSGRLKRACGLSFAGLGLSTAVVFGVLVPSTDDRGREWAWYESVGRRLGPSDRLLLMYDWDGPEPWDRLPYPTPWGDVPPDLAVRLFYLGADAWGRVSFVSSGGRPDRALREVGGSERGWMVVGRRRDEEALGRLGEVEVVDEGPVHRWDRAYVLMRVASASGVAAAGGGVGR